MPEGDVHILGANIHRSQLPLVLGVGAIAAYLLLRPRVAASGGTTGAVDTSGANAAAQLNLEYQMLQNQAAYQMQQLSAMTSLQQQQLTEAYNLQAGMNPGLLSNCIAYLDWYALDQTSRNAVQQQVNNGQLLMTPGSSGWCFTPTTMGVAGHPPLVTQRTNTGLFGSSGSVTGYPSTAGGAPAAQQPFILQLLQALGL